MYIKYICLLNIYIKYNLYQYQYQYQCYLYLLYFFNIWLVYSYILNISIHVIHFTMIHLKMWRYLDDI